MPIAVFANKTFQVNSQKIYTFDDLTMNSSLETEKQDAANKKPSTYIKGPDLYTMSFSIPLDVSMGVNVRNEYGAWKALVEAGKPYPFILGGIPLGANKWLLKSASLNNTVIDSNGNILSGTIQLEFEEYVRPGSAQASKSTKKTSTSYAPGISLPKVSGNINLLGSSDKADIKRSNPNMLSRLPE
ncbi:hypothetical protein D2962_06185 [Biomaibacter acetigenes]|uniref:Phage tail protein n=1 Tax=Biomaibacter acetigenes TaxID=2316383 RepID=A0A3G2R469_9FIRM|nr:phage tail protein [Biomaibacter acetigenes]AYO30260.1 hypothetical protein D2962_06185 [Biomaibacter acetigenes]